MSNHAKHKFLFFSERCLVPMVAKTLESIRRVFFFFSVAQSVWLSGRKVNILLLYRCSPRESPRFRYILFWREPSLFPSLRQLTRNFNFSQSRLEESLCISEGLSFRKPLTTEQCVYSTGPPLVQLFVGQVYLFGDSELIELQFAARWPR